MISEPQLLPAYISNSETDSDSEEVMNQFVVAMDNSVEMNQSAAKKIVVD